MGVRLASEARRAERRLRDLISEFVQGAIDVEEFERRFLDEARAFEDRGPKPVLDLVYSVELALAEHSHGHWTEDELKRVIARSLEIPAAEQGVARRASSA